MLSKKWILIFVGLITTSTVTAQNVTDARNLLTDLLTVYDYRIRPVVNQSLVVNVYVGMTLIAVNEINDVEEVMKTTAFLDVLWTDETLRWDTNTYNDIASIFLPQDDLWKPDITLKNSYGDFKKMGLSTLNVEISNTGGVEWYPFQKFESSCSINVRYFPFDVQTCRLVFVAWSYGTDEVVFNVLSLDMSQYEESSTWTILDTKAEVTNDQQPTVMFTLRMKRKPLYMILSVVLPIVLLSMLDLFIFILPCESGEKVGYAVTVFLAFAVFLTLVEQSMPKNSESLAIFSTYMIILTFNSTLVTFISIAMLKVLSYEDLGVPKVFVWMSKIGEFKFCRKSKRKHGSKVGVQDLTLKDVSKDEENGKVIMSDSSSEITSDDDENQKPTWKGIMNGLELFFLYFFSFELFLVSMVILLGVSYGTI